jgi:membrane protein implicated in regulation of membrane protease activity
MLIYMAIGGVGFLLLVGMLLLGDVLGGDHDGHVDPSDAGGPGIFSARVMAAFLTAFGVGGVVARYYGWSHPAASGAGVVAGFTMATLVYQFARVLYTQQASTDVVMSSLVGQTAQVSVAIPERGIGQVTLNVAGSRSDHLARAADGRAVPLGATVVITALGGDGVMVAPAQQAAQGGR